jgi:hypothetical protein
LPDEHTGYFVNEVQKKPIYLRKNKLFNKIDGKQQQMGFIGFIQKKAP